MTLEPLLAAANFLLPHSTPSSSRSLLALTSLMPRLFSHGDISKGKGKAVLGDEHDTLEYPDWLHAPHRMLSYLIYRSRCIDTVIFVPPTIQIHLLSALIALGSPDIVHDPSYLTSTRQDTVCPASGNANTRALSPVRRKRPNTPTLARPIMRPLPSLSIALLMASPCPTLPTWLISKRLGMHLRNSESSLLHQTLPWFSHSLIELCPSSRTNFRTKIICVNLFGGLCDYDVPSDNSAISMTRFTRYVL